MAKRKLIFILMLTNFLANGQSITGMNFRHLYDPADKFDFRYSLTNEGRDLILHYSLRGVTSDPTDLIIQWERRDSYSDRKGIILRTDTISLAANDVTSGSLTVNPEEKPWILLAGIRNVSSNEPDHYHIVIENNYPEKTFFKNENNQVFDSYLLAGTNYQIASSSGELLHGYHYSVNFPSALPPFSTKSGGADPVMLPDSSFTISASENVNFNRSGLYLLQADTAKAEGISFRVESASFPKFSRIEDLAGPLVYITTQDEFTELKNAGGDKAKFDKVILDITRDRDRAREFMRNYYQRVELANRYFTSFKQGWKTDKGMVFIIFGLPDNVILGNGSEIWYYKSYRTRFIFNKRPSLYDPDYYVLQRDKSYSELWYNTVDLWRKSRF